MIFRNRSSLYRSELIALIAERENFSSCSLTMVREAFAIINSNKVFGFNSIIVESIDLIGSICVTSTTFWFLCFNYIVNHITYPFLYMRKCFYFMFCYYWVIFVKLQKYITIFSKHIIIIHTSEFSHFYLN